MGWDVIPDGTYRTFSLLVTGYLLLSILSLHTGLVERSYLLPTILTLLLAVALRYAAVYHRFSRPVYRTAAFVPLCVAFVASGAVALGTFRSTVSRTDLRDVLQRETLSFGSTASLDEWLLVGFLAVGGLLAFVGSVQAGDRSSYPRPTGMCEIATSPVYLGATCTFFGMWAVLFVGIAIERIVIVAPIFEELLKFGVALAVGSVLFGRSLPARIGVAVVVGSLFGHLEHVTTYPTESDVTYLFRTVFHSVTTVLSVSIYTLFESRGDGELQWIAPAYPVILHFLYNTAVVLSTVGSVLVFGSQNTVVSLVYGVTVILQASGLLLLRWLHPPAIVALHRPLKYVLSDLV